MTPLIERKEKLHRLIARNQCSEITYAQHERDGRLLFEEVCQRNLEGMVCKRKTGMYAGHGWLKVRNTHYTQMEARHEMLTAFRERPRMRGLRAEDPSYG